MTDEIKDVIAKFKAEGWGYCRTSFEGGVNDCGYLYKVFDSKHTCRCNIKGGTQVSLSPWHIDTDASYTLEACVQLYDGSWIKFQNYAINKIGADFDAQCKRLVAAVDAIQQISKDANEKACTN